MESTTYTPFTDETWSAHHSRGLLPGCRIEGGWMGQNDLAHELNEHHENLDMGACLALVSGAVSGLPLEVEWKNTAGHTTRAVVLVVQLFGHYTRRDGYAIVPGRMHVRYWGCAHSIQLEDVSSIEAPSAVYTDNDAEPAPGEGGRHDWDCACSPELGPCPDHADD